MAIDTQGSVTFYLSIAKEHKDFLGSIRHWINVKLGYDEEIIWLKGFNTVQLDSLEVKSIPYKKIYFSDGPKLFLKDSLLPERNIPSLLWTSIDRGLAIELPAFNHNYFGMQGTLPIKLVQSNEEQEAYAIMVSLRVLENYMIMASAIRFKNLKWLIINESKAVVFGTPILPLDGEAYWRHGSFLIPSGYNLQFEILYTTLDQIINEKKEHWIIWNKNGSYSKIEKDALASLSLSSLRLTLKGTV